ncbi:MAG: FAD:protein FMN transferase [Alphaproteobacteria bacterium]|nr:FAD:protein FMN transferase [Alphaproteobacteria bacterium]
MIGRRQVLTILAGAALAPGLGAAAEWQGQALGADARILIRGGEAPAALLAHVRTEIAALEAVFSLYRDSELTRLNRDGAAEVSETMIDALDLAMRVHRATNGLFDPAVQVLWRQRVSGQGGVPLQPFGGLRRQGTRLRLAPGQALTLNGIAQGLATDRVIRMLTGQRLGQVLVDLGEARALDGDFRLELEDPQAGVLGQLTLRRGRAVATSAPGAMILADGQGHIMGPQGQPPRWSTVSVEADSAALADAASTAFVLMDRDGIARAADALNLHAVRLVDDKGDLTTL